MDATLLAGTIRLGIERWITLIRREVVRGSELVFTEFVLHQRGLKGD